MAGFVVRRVLSIAEYRAQGARLVAQAERLPREYAVGDGEPLRMAVLGDSTAVGVGAGSLEATLGYRVAKDRQARVTITNLGVSGVTLLDVVRDQLPNLTPGTTLVLVSASANDATHGTSRLALGNALEALLEGFRSRGVQAVVVTTTPNFRTTPALPWVVNRLFERRASALTKAIREGAARHPEVCIADLNQEGTLSEDQYAADGFHPNAAGYAVWTEIVERALGQARP